VTHVVALPAKPLVDGYDLAANLWDLCPVSPIVVTRRQGLTLMNQTCDTDSQGFQKCHPRALGLRLHTWRGLVMSLRIIVKPSSSKQQAKGQQECRKQEFKGESQSETSQIQHILYICTVKIIRNN
jgi:hypothetical protein